MGSGKVPHFSEYMVQEELDQIKKVESNLRQRKIDNHM